MIRRNLPLGSDPQQWLLISQIEHARLSHALAERWGNVDVPPVICTSDDPNPAQRQVRREVLAAIMHHDDGWAEWEAAPTLDTEFGRPLDFMEMPQRTAVAIWEKSIRAARQVGPLAGWIVAGHFLALLEKSHQPIETETAEWRTRIEEERAAWLANWFAADREFHTPSLADESLRWLQTFDWLSLWLCCACPVVPSDAATEFQPLELHVADSNSPTIEFKPHATPSGFDVFVEPWPFDEQELTLSAPSSAVPAMNYANSEKLLAAYQPKEPHWRLRSE